MSEANFALFYFSIMESIFVPKIDFTLWACVKDGESVKVAESVENKFQLDTFDENMLYTITPNGKLWRHVLTMENKSMYILCGDEIVSEQVYHAKSGPYFYITRLPLLIALSS